MTFHIVQCMKFAACSEEIRADIWPNLLENKELKFVQEYIQIGYIRVF